MKLQTPISYQGGKQRIANKIVDIIYPHLGDKTFYDICCGSGSISIEMVNRGIDPAKIVMIDQGPWGLFWKMIGDGTFDIDKFREWCSKVPKNTADIQSYIKELSRQKSFEDTVYVFLLLQASSFGGKAIWFKGEDWKNCSFRSYWQPTLTSNRKSPVNPMMPMPDTLFERVRIVAEKMKGIIGCNVSADSVAVSIDAVIYIDPPYDDTTAYGYSFDYMKFVSEIGKVKCFVSEGKSLSDKYHLIETVRLKGGISGTRKSYNEEWLSEFN